MVDAPAAPRKGGTMKKVAIGLSVAVALFLGFVAIQPAEFSVRRAATMAAPPAAIFEQVNDFKRWQDWSPWEKMDPAMKRSFSPQTSGKDASYAWVGNEKVGEGRMTITESTPPERVVIRLEFLKPFPATNTSEFVLKPEGAQTTLTWTMSGHKNFISKGVCLFMDMDKMVGADFEKGLARIKALVETAPAK